MNSRIFSLFLLCMALSVAALLPVRAAETLAQALPAAVNAPAQAAPAEPAPAQPAPAAQVAITAPAPLDTAALFQQRYQARDAVAQNPKRRASEGKEFNALTGLGVQAVPLMIAKMEQSPDEAAPLADAVERITRKTLHRG